MTRKIYTKVRIENIAYQIALWELTGRGELAAGLRQFFASVVSEANIEQHKADLAKANPDLAVNYVPQPANVEKKQARRGKTGTFREIRTIRNRSGRGGKTYRWVYEVEWKNGRRIKSKSIGRAEQVVSKIVGN